jgi:2-iminobutanoate/2-iminopropanoate deaminase
MSENQPKVFGPYSPIRQVGDLYFIAGQVGVEFSTKTTDPKAGAQIAKAIDNLEDVLASVDLTLKDVVKTTLFLTNMDDSAEVGKVYAERFSDPLPARSTVAVKELPRIATNGPLKVEIEAIAARRQD